MALLGHHALLTEAISPSLLDASPTFYTPQLPVSPPDLLDASATFYTPTVLLGLEIKPDLHDASPTFYLPQLPVSPPSLLDASPTFYAPELTLQNIYARQFGFIPMVGTATGI